MAAGAGAPPGRQVVTPTMSLRIRAPATPPPSPRQEPPAGRILVVDDVPEICQLFKGLARRIRGFDVHLATEINSSRALERVRSESFDIVVSDYRMREVDGVEVLRTSHAHNPRGLRVLMTGYNEVPTTVERIRSAHVDAYVRKPLQAQDLLLLLVGFLHRHEATLDAHRAGARDIEAMATVQDGPTP